MLKTVRKRKHALLFFVTFIATFSILFGGFVVGGPVLADDNQPEPPVDPGEGIEGGQEEEEEEEQEEEEQEEEEQEEEEQEDDEDDDDDGVSDEDEDKLSREIKIEQEDNKVKIESELKYGENKDEFKVELEGQEGLEIKYEYESEAGSEESNIELKVEFTQLIEYNDIDGDGFNETDILTTHPLEDFSYTINPLAISDTGEKLHEINATSAISENGGVFKVRVLVSEYFTLISGQQFEPTTLKIDIEIIDFPYTDMSDTIHLALETKVELETSASVEYLKDNDGNLVGVNAKIGDYSAVFTWVSDVAGTDKPGTVGAKIFEKEFEQTDETYIELKLYLLYPRGTHIIHDPKIGIPLSALPYAQGIVVSVPQMGIIAEKLQEVIPYISIASLLFGALVATLLVIPVPIILRRRRR